MGTATRVQDGKYINYTPSSAVSSGDVVVLGDLVTVADLDIAADELGNLTLEGVYDFPKASGVSTAITVGTKLYWDEADQQATDDDDSGTNKYLGKNIQAAGDDDETVKVKLGQQ